MIYNSKNEMFVKIIRDSISPSGKRIVTFHAHYPRIIHGEVMTHRVFSRNARSSRAVPVKTIIQEVLTKPYIPWHWGKNQKGMQATEECNESVFITKPGAMLKDGVPQVFENRIAVKREAAWIWGRDQALALATAFMNSHYHKQIINRILEPYSWIDTLITTTDLSNFYHLRDHEDAEPHFHDLAKLVRHSVDQSVPVRLNEGDWHLPFITAEDFVPAYEHSDKTEQSLLSILQKLSVARCARISYSPFDGNASIEKEIERYELLVGSEPLHASPAEHQAYADFNIGSSENGDVWKNPQLSGNLGPGFVQYRKTLPNECFHGKW